VDGNEALGHGHIEGPAWIMIVATVVSLLGIFLAWLIYGKKSIARDWLTTRMPITYNILYNKYYIDEFYELTVVNFTKGFTIFLSYIEVFVVEGLVKTVTGIVQGLGKIGSKIQSGQVQAYGTVAFVGLAVLIVIYALTGGYLK
jgi:NADH-quinone oxidoreductase subunit L